MIEKNLSNADPYIERMSHTGQKEFKMLHYAVQRTEDLLEKFCW
jgi:hypothetical protein